MGGLETVWVLVVAPVEAVTAGLEVALESQVISDQVASCQGVWQACSLKASSNSDIGREDY